MKITYLSICVALGLAFTGLNFEAIAAPANGATAAISKVDGNGIAKVRRKSGIESVAGVKQELFPGDRITTDSRSVVEIILADGSLVRVGLNSEYRLESVNSKTGIFSWVFSLTKGSIRALVEKNPKKGVVKFRVNTPVGTMGVRGTELVLDHNPRTKRTTLHTIEGRVEFGAKNCHIRRDCVEVATGETSSVGADSGPGKPKVEKTDTLSMLLMNGTGDGRENGTAADGATAEERLARAALFEDLKKAELLVSNSEGSISAEQKTGMEELVKGASEAMAAAQDLLIGRTKEQRERTHRDMENGSYQEKLKLAEKFDDLTSDGKKPAAERTKENLSAAVVQKKLNLADAVLRTKAMKKALAKAEAKQEDIQAKIEETKKLFQEVQQAKQTAANTQAAEEAKKQEDTKQAEAGGVDEAAVEDPGSGVDGSEETSVEALKQVTKDFDKSLADAVLSDKTVVLAKESYTYKDTYCIPFICWTDTETRTEAIHTVSTKVERKSGICYETKKECQREMIPCDLKSGKSCKPKFTEYKCEEKKVQTSCPSS